MAPTSPQCPKEEISKNNLGVISSFFTHSTVRSILRQLYINQPVAYMIQPVNHGEQESVWQENEPPPPSSYACGWYSLLRRHGDSMKITGQSSAFMQILDIVCSINVSAFLGDSINIKTVNSHYFKKALI